MLEKQYIKIYGDRNSGTRYLERLIKKNLNVKILPGVVPKFVRIITKRLKKRNKIRAAYHKFSYYRNLGWKHTIVKSPQELEKYRICLKNIVFLTISKNLIHGCYHYIEDHIHLMDLSIAIWILKTFYPRDFILWNMKILSI